jgi:hypothetical protein
MNSTCWPMAMLSAVFYPRLVRIWDREAFRSSERKYCRTRDRSALASREKYPCFQFARLLRARPSGVRGPVLLPP